MKIGQRHAEHVLHSNNACSGIGVWVCRPGRKRRMARGPEGRLPEKRASLPVPSVLALRQNTPPMRPATPSAPPNTDDITHTHLRCRSNHWHWTQQRHQPQIQRPSLSTSSLHSSGHEPRSDHTRPIVVASNTPIESPDAPAAGRGGGSS